MIAGMKEAVTPSTEPLMDLFYRALSDEEPEVQTNAAFATGMLIEHSQMDLSAQYMHVLGALRPLFMVGPDAAPNQVNARDNAVGAVSRMIFKSPNAVPLDQVLPVLFTAVPLTQDYLENRPLFRMLFNLFRTQPQVLQPYMDQILVLLAHVMEPSADTDQLGDDLRGEVIALINALFRESPDQIRKVGLEAFVVGA